MKKLIVTLLTILTCSAACALPVGNPADASLLCDGLFLEGYCGDPCDPCLTWCDALSFRFGFYGDYVFNRHLQVDENDTTDARVEETEIFTNAGYLALNFWDRFDFFATLGATNIFLDTNATTFAGVGGQRIQLVTETSFSWSLGARATIWECGCTLLGIEGQYFRTHPEVSRISTATSSIYPDDSTKAIYQEWQVGIGLSHRINIFVPYIAVKWSHATLDFDDATFADPVATLFNLANTKSWGYAVGVSLIDCEKASLAVEGRFADEKALYVNGQIRF